MEFLVYPCTYPPIIFQRTERQRLKVVPVRRAMSTGFEPKAFETNLCQREERVGTTPFDNQERKPMISSNLRFKRRGTQQGKDHTVPIQISMRKDDSIRLRKSKEMSSYMLLSIVLLFILTHSFRLAFRIYEIVMPNGNTSENFVRCYNIGR
jgi:hypothetical protein